MGCLWGVLKSRFTSVGDIIDLKKLKHSDTFDTNAVDICPGHQRFPPAIRQDIEREYYCPYLRSRMDERVCQWVHSETHDPQKSKPIGQVAIIFEALGLAKLITTGGGIVKKLEWTENARYVANLNWGTAELNNFLISEVLSYGPITALVKYIDNLSSIEFRNRELHDKIMILPTNETVNTRCRNGTITRVHVWDGNTSNDAAVRSTTALLNLLANTGLILPAEYGDSTDITPSVYYEWLIQRAINGNINFPRVWVKNSNKIHEYLMKTPTVKRGVSYSNFIPKATDRNRGNRCRCCNDNIINNARHQFGDKSRNRKLLLLMALKKASANDSCVDLEELSNLSLTNSNFYISSQTQYTTLLNTERHNISLYGCPSILKNNKLLKPIAKMTDDAFEPIPPSLKHQIEEMLNDSKVILRCSE